MGLVETYYILYCIYTFRAAAEVSTSIVAGAQIRLEKKAASHRFFTSSRYPPTLLPPQLQSVHSMVTFAFSKEDAR